MNRDTQFDVTLSNPATAAMLTHHFPQLRVRGLAEQGFSLIEVFAAILITMISLTVALQMFMTAVLINFRAQQLDGAYNWVQQDYEAVRAKAAKFEQNVAPYSTYCDEDPASNLAATFIQNNAQGLGGASVTVGTKTFDGQDYTLIRSADYVSTADPNRLVGLQYDLISQPEGKTIYTRVASVLIYASLRCPA